MSRVMLAHERARIHVFAVASLALALGCSGERAHATMDGGDRADGSTLDDGGTRADGVVVRPDAGPPLDGGPDCVPYDGLSLVERLTSLSDPIHVSAAIEQGFVLSGTRMLVSMPRHLSPSLEALTVVDLAESPPRVRALPVSGDVPRGRVDVYAQLAGADRIVAIVRPPTFIDFEVIAVDFSATAATFSRLTSVSPPAQPGDYFVGALYASGPSTLVAIWPDGYAYPLTIEGGEARWGEPSPQPGPPTRDSGVMVHSVVSDPDHGRLLGFGLDFYGTDSPPEARFAPRVFELSLVAPPYAWTELTLSGTAPPEVAMPGVVIDGPWAAYDRAGDRLVVEAPKLETSPFGGTPTLSPTLWIVDLAARTWRLAAEHTGLSLRAAANVPYTVDAAAERIVELNGTGLNELSFAAATMGRTSRIATDGELSPSDPRAAARLSDGRIVVSDEDHRLLSLDPRAGVLGWRSYGPTVRPPDLGVAQAAAIAATPAGGLLVLGAFEGSSVTWSSAYEVSADERTFTRVVLSDAPAPRSQVGVVQAGSTLYVAGGLVDTTGVESQEVWALDLAARRWRLAGTLPEARLRPAIWPSATGELWIVGGLEPAHAPSFELVPIESVVAMDASTGATRPITTDGMWPPGGVQTPVVVSDGVFAVSYGSDDTIDMTNGGVFKLGIDVAASRASWMGGPTCQWDASFYPAVGVGSGDDGYLLGSYAWLVSGPR